MIHYGKDPHEDKVIIEVSNEDLLHLKNVLMVMPLPERRVFHGIKELLETDQALRKYIDPQMQGGRDNDKGVEVSRYRYIEISR